MKAPNWKTCSERELWKYVASHLERKGISTILVGGAVVSIYSDGAYRSGDLDFVLLGYLADKLPAVLAEIGFKKKSGRHFQHPRCHHLFIEFQNPPVGIGDDTDIKPDEMKVDGQRIKIYSPTDCIRDRLASYIHFNARECLDQALLVAAKHPFNMKKIERWCRDEGASEAFFAFRDALRNFAEGETPIEAEPNPLRWRLCPEGQHWRRAHRQGTYQRKDGTIVSEHEVSAGCCKNPSGKDQFYPDEIQEIASRHFKNLTGQPHVLKLRPNLKRDPNAFDNLIAGWVQYWNAVFNPKVPLDPDTIKALLWSESSYNPNPKSQLASYRNYARGLMQITDDTRKILANDKGELTDHLIHLTKEDVKDPGTSICAAVRWLFHEKDLASSKLKREATWEEAVLKYKAYLKDYISGKNKNPSGLRKFREELGRLKGAK